MMNIIRSINYETRKSKILIRMYIVFVLLMALIALLNINTDADNMTYTSGMLSENKTIPFMFPLFIVAMFIMTYVNALTITIHCEDILLS